MEIQPLRDNVLIKVDKDATSTSSGILIQREWERLPHTGEVLAIGPDVKEIKVGNRVRFNRYAFEKVVLDKWVDDDTFLGLEKNIPAKLHG